VPFSRRKFIKTGTMVGLSAMVPSNNIVAALGKLDKSTRPSELFKAPGEAHPDGRLTEENFSRHLHSSFLILYRH
jgi:hypothetical protein